MFALRMVLLRDESAGRQVSGGTSKGVQGRLTLWRKRSKALMVFVLLVVL